MICSKCKAEGKGIFVKDEYICIDCLLEGRPSVTYREADIKVALSSVGIVGRVRDMFLMELRRLDEKY